MTSQKKADAKEVPTDAYKRRAWIICELKCEGTSLAKVARSLGVTQQSVNSALFSSSARIEAAVAKALGLEVETLFPERFLNGTRLGTSRSSIRTINEKPFNDQTSVRP